MEVLVTIGLNDIWLGSGGRFQIEMQRWREWLQKHGLRKGLKHQLYFTELPRPPLFVWFKANGAVPPNYVSYEDKLNDVNERIKNFNELHHPNKMVVSFKNDGRRSLKKRGEQQVWASWREVTKSNMLHLADHVRVSMLNRIEKFYRLNTA